MAEVIARVGRITGEVVARDPDGNVRRLKSGDPIREGDVVQAVDGAQVVLRLADGRDLTVNANEAARIDAEVAAPDLPDAGDSAVQNNPRGFLKVAKAIVGADGTFSFGDDAGQVRNAADQKDGHSFIELVRIVEFVEPLSFQFATTRFPLNDTIEGGPAALFDALNAATAASLASQPPGVLLVDGATRVTAELAPASDSGIAGDNLTNDATPTIRGTGEPDAVDNGTVLVPAVTTAEDTAALNINVLGNDTDPENNPLTVTAASSPNGAVTINPDGTLNFTPVANFNGNTTISYTISDGQGGTDTATVYVTVTPVNDAPDAVDNGTVLVPAVTTAEDTAALNINVLGNDTDPENNPLTVTAASSPNGAVTINPDGTLNFTPVANFNGNTTISYTISDGQGGTDTATVYVTVTPVNDAPDAVDNGTVLVPAVTTAEDTAALNINVLGNDTDPENNPLTVTAASSPNGAVTINPDGTLNFTPVANFNGNTTISYTISDGQGGTDTATVYVTVTPVNDAPDAVDNGTVLVPAVTTAEDTAALNINVLGNDTDPENNPLTVTAASSPNGAVTINPDGTLNFTPVANFNGNTTISYTISDGQGGTDTATVYVTVTPVNDAPDAVDNGTVLVPAVTTAEDTAALNINVLGNDTDPENNPLTVTAASSPNGAVTINPDGTLNFTPVANFNGNTTISYTISDGQGGTDTATVYVTVTPVNDAPDAVDNGTVLVPAVTTAEDTAALNINVLGNDTDPENNPLTVTAASSPNGAVTINPDGTLNFTPVANFNGNTTISYTISDGQGGTDTATVYVTVTPVNDAPDAVDNGTVLVPAVTTAEDTAALNINVLGNDTDPENNPLTVTAASSPNGAVTINPDGTLNFTPVANFNGNTTISYTISDGQGGTDTATVYVTVTPVNDAPDAVDNGTVLVPAVTTAEDTAALNINVLGNDTDPENNPLTVTAASSPNGAVTINPDGTLNFTPVANFNGNTTISYTISDGQGGTDTATVYVTVTPVNDAPDAVDNGTVLVPAVTTAEDTAALNINVLGNDTDPENNPLTVTAASSPNGAVTINPDGTLNFTPVANFNGNTTISYTISDGQGGTDTATVYVTVTPVNDAPDAVDNGTVLVPAVTTAEDTAALNINVLGNDTDPENNPLTVTAASSPNGAVTINPDGTLNFTPVANFNGNTTISYTISDGQGGTDTATVYVTVTPVNDAPDAVDNGTVLVPAVTTAEDTAALNINVLGNDTDPENNPLTVTAASSPNGAVTINPDGTLNFTPVANFNGNTTISYTISDGQGGTDTATVYVTVTPVNDAPDAVDNGTVLVPAVTTAEDTAALNINVLGNDTDPENNPLTVTAASSPNGAVTINPDGTLNFTPVANFNGNTTISYTISDGQGGTDTATVYVTVTPVNDAPDAVDNGTVLVPAVTTAEDTAALNINVLGNDTDPENNPLTVTAASSPNGAVTINPDGTLNFTPVANFNGNTTISYTISDGQGGTDTATVYVTVTPVNDAPDAVDNGTVLVPAVTTAEDTAALNINVLGNDTDPENNPLTVTAASSPNGAVTINPDGTLNFTPVANFNGNTTISYTISDGQGGTDTATVYVTVTPVNDAPDAVDNGTVLVPAVTTAEDTAALNINVLGNDTDPENNPLTVTAASSPNGAVTINPDGTLNFTPVANFNGNTTISYTISDGQGGTDTATVYVTVTPVNDAPDAVDNGTVLVPAVTTAEDTAALNINVLGNDTDPENNPLTVTAASSPNGAVTINPDGTLNFTPVANFNGNTTISYTISDGQGGTDTATVYVTVTPVNDAPDAVDNGTVLVPAVTTAEDTAALNINVLGNDTDPENNPLTVTAASSPNGAVTINPDGTLNFTPVANFNGNTTISYTISDGQGGTDTATVYVTVTPVNDAPDAVDNGTVLVPAVTTAEDTAALNINVLGNDTDPENNPLTVTAASSPNGAVTINPDGTLNFTPVANFNGNTTISYTISDGQGGTDTATVYVTVTPVNDAPDAVDNGTVLVPAVTTAEDTAALNINVLGNDTDPENNPLTVTAASSPNGAVTINPDGTLNFTPVANFNGNTTISYTISDGQGGTDTATVYVTVTPVNDAPDAVDNGTVLVPAVTTAEDTAALNINVLGNDTDPENNPLTVTAASSPNGAVTINPDGTLNFTPVANFNGNTTISYTISDGQGGTDTATVYVTVTPVNDAPDAVDNGTVLVPAVTTAEDTAALNINVLGNDTDPENNPLTVTAASSPNGAVTINPDGTLNFTPVANFNGNTTISYTISDGQGGTDTATVYVTVTPVNDAPDAVDNGTVLVPAVTTAEDTAALNINVLGNDTDPENNPLTVTAASSPNGAVTINPDGTLNFTPVANFNGNTTISYTISDGQGGTDTATVYVTVTPVNDAPDAVDNGTVLVPAVTTAEDTAALNINVLGNDTDPENNPLTVTAASSPNGAVTINPDGTLNFTPVANFNGNTTISYTISDGQGGTDTATVYVTVTPVNDAPDAVDNGTVLVPAVTTAEDTAALNINVLGNDTDPENNPLTVTAASSPNGAVTINPDGTLNFTPVANFNGNTTISYTISDGQGGTDTATVYVTVTPVNDAPDAVDNGTVLVPAVTTAEDTAALNINVLGNDTDPENNPLTVTAASSPNGAVTINPDGTLNFTPVANFNGNTTISYTISDGQGGTDTATVYVTVTPVNDAPDAVDNGTVLVPAVTTAEDTAALNINVLGNDTDPENNPLTVTAASSPNGAVTINPDGTLNFTPVANFNGNTTISYTISDGQGGTDTATVYVTVTPVNDAPDAVDNGTVLVPAVTTAEDTAALNINVLGNDTDPENNPLTVTAASSPNGAVTINPDGTLNFTPVANFNGNTTISYTISDGQGGTDTATVYVTVTPVNDAPDAVDNGTVLVPAVTTAEDTAALNINVLGNDTDPENNPLTVTAASSPNGAVTINPDGTLNFTPVANFNGNTTISYTISDGQGGTDTATVYVTVTPVNDAPDAVDNGTVLVPAVTTAEDTAALNINVLGNDTDPENNPLTVTAASSPNGAVTINPDGTLNFTPVANFNGNTTISYTISDGQGGTDTATVYVTVTPVNDAPDAVDNGTVLVPAVTTAEDTAALNINVLGNDTDPENNPLTVTAASSPNGAVTINPDGTLNFTPVANFNGNTTISYTISDGQGGTDTATVYVTVTPVNDAPDAVDNGTVLVPAVTTAEDTAALNINVLGNDTDPENNPLTVTAASSPNGAVTINPDGTLNFTPVANFNGNTTISYTISDGQGGTDTATVYVTVTPVNDAPDAVDNGTVLVPAVTTAEDTAALNINVLGNDTDPENNPLTVTAASSPNGAVTINPDGTLNFTPVANFNGNTTISYTISDGQGGTDTATVYVTVTPVNDAPDAVDNGTVLVPAVTTAEDTAALNINVLGNDTDPENNPLTVTAASSPNGAVTINPDGTLNFTPVANFNGNTTISYTISDGQGGTDTATVYVTVTPVNDAPVNTVPGAQTTAEDTAKVFSVANGNAITVGDIDSASVTTVVSVTGGTLTALATAGVTITNNGTGSVTLVGSPANITTALNGLSYVPTADYNGAATLTVSTSDGVAPAVINTVALTVTAVVDIANDSVTTNEDTLVNINVNGNDSFENAGHTITAINGTAIAVNGTVAVTGGTVTLKADGTLDFQPTADYNGTPSFTYTVSSGGVSETATVTVTVSPVNDAPVTDLNGAVAGSNNVAAFTEQTAVLIAPAATITGVDSANLTSMTVTLTARPDGNAVESLSLNAAATAAAAGLTVSYTAGTGVLLISGSASKATYQNILQGIQYNDTSDTPSLAARTVSVVVNDGALSSVANTVTVNVTAVNDAPVNTLPASYTTNEDTSVKLGGLSVADVDAASGTLTVTLAVGSGTLTAASAGGVTVAGSGTGTVTLTGTLANLNTYLATAANQPTYVPVGNANGTVALTMTTSDGGNTGTSGPLSDTDSININVTAVADTPSLNFSALVYTATSITSANATTTTNGFNMLAYNPNGSAGAISLKTGSPDGFGVSGAASGDTTELGYLAGTGSESLVVNFDNLVSSVDVSFAWLAAGERYTVQFLNGGTVVGGYTSSIGGTDGVDAVTTLKPVSGAQFNQIIFSAPAGDNDYLINKIVFDRVTSSGASTVNTNDNGVVNLGLTSSLADADGSETLKVVISGIPSGFTLTDGSNTFTALGAAGATSNVDVTGWSISSIKLVVPANVQGTAHLTATATATETSNLDSASLSRTVDVVITHPQTSVVDTVITNTAVGTAFDVPMSAFLYNDVGADSISAISAASGLSASLSGANVRITDTTPAGGSFSYTASTSVFDLDNNSTVVKTSTGSVTVTRDSGDMDGTTADNILVDTSTNATTINGLAGNDVLVSTAASGGDTLNGGAGNDMLTGGAGADTFVWNLADRGTLANPARDVITDFNTATYASGGDRLDLRDILQGTATTATALDSYLDFSKQGSDTVINVRPTGAGGEMTQQIVLQGVDLTSNGTLSDQTIIQDLLTKGKLQTD